MDAEQLKFWAAIAGPIVAALALLVSLSSFYVARSAERRAKRAESVKELLGEKETVAFAALKLLRDGLPAEQGQRGLIISALMQACVFEGSDRARALLFSVIEENRGRCGPEMLAALNRIQDIFTSTDGYQFTKEELNLERGKRRIGAVVKVTRPGGVATPPNPPLQPTGSAGG